jgi:hypothetical protein
MWAAAQQLSPDWAARVGVIGFDPNFHFRTNDPRTPNSYEGIWPLRYRLPWAGSV